MNSKINRFQKRKQIVSSNTYATKQIPNSNEDQQYINNIIYNESLTIDLTVSSEEVKTFLDNFQKNFNQERFNKLVNDCKKEVIQSIVTPFGLGKIISAYDKVGGNVDTIHNARDGIYATEQEQDAYSERGDYNSDDYHKDKNYIDINKKYSQDRKNGKATDYMTGNKLDENQSHDLDHVKSAKEIHDDAGRILAEIDGTTLANTETNLKPTSASSNRSKKADDMQTFLNKKNERIKKIKILKEKESLTQKEKNELDKLEKLSEIDDKIAIEADKKARKKIDKEINKTYYGSRKFVKNTAITSGKEGAKMGMQQAIGLIMSELFEGTFDEIFDIYKNGFSNGFDDESFFKILKERLQRIGKRITAKWKDVVIAFKDGFISGFISNLVTTVVNMFITTGKRLVRIIREGFFSLYKAVKLLLFPPEDMTYSDAMHEASKIIASGLIITLGVVAEEWIDSLIKTTVVLEPFSDILTTIFVGAITGIAVTMTVYYIDKNKNNKNIMASLLQQQEEAIARCEQTIDNIKNTLALKP